MSGGFTEYTYVDGHDEVMVHREGAKVTRVYTYRDAKFLVPAGHEKFKINPDYDDLTPAMKRLRWAAKSNSSFVHASQPKVAYEYLIDSGFTSGGPPDEADPYEDT